MGIIRVKNIACYSHHGCLEEETIIGQQYLVDVEVNLDFSEAAATDDLTNTIDYCDINRIVEEEMAIRSKLIEHVGQRILNRFKAELNQLEAAEIEIKKINPPINGNVDYVSVVLKS
ncbi:MAG: dihydroneopterin aldolase [Bacteroidia bacterium]|jgi:dihydroneopterin aldolase